jgi:hypothetical protein
MMDEEKTVVTAKRPDQSRLKVTKEELDASGLSLRDYMNKQLGLKRRDGSAPESVAKTSTPPAVTKKKSEFDFDPAGLSSDTITNSREISRRNQRSADASGETAKTNAKLEAANKLTNKDASKSEPPRFKSPIVKLFEGIRERGDKDLAERGMKKGGKVQKMANGGSASSRADGIASKGKTRGKMC